jgi:hypothetical protein
LREFVERLFTPSQGTNTVRLLPEQLPGNLPFELPLPPQSRIAGSVVYGGANDKIRNVNIILDVPGTAASVLSFYQSELATRGWSVLPPGPGVQQGPQPGFQVAPTTAPSSQNFCHDADKTLLWLTVSSKPTGLNDVRLNVEMTPSTLCTDAALATGSTMLGVGLTSSRSSLEDRGGADRNAGGPQHPQDTNPLPPLFAPEGVSFSSQGGGGGSGCWNNEVTAITDQEVAKLEAHFARQLQDTGWTRQAGQVEGPLAWSCWQGPGEGALQGVLTVREGTIADQRLLRIEVSSATTPFGPYNCEALWEHRSPATSTPQQ